MKPLEDRSLLRVNHHIAIVNWVANDLKSTISNLKMKDLRIPEKEYRDKNLSGSYHLVEFYNDRPAYKVSFCYWENFESGFMESDLFYLDVLVHTSTVWSMKPLEDRPLLCFNRYMMWSILLCYIFHWAGCHGRFDIFWGVFKEKFTRYS